MTADYSHLFSHWDYLVFLGLLSVSGCIGLYYAIQGRNEKDPKYFLLGGGEMGVIPVSLSLLATFMSAITLLGVPLEIYSHGTSYMLTCVCFLITIPITAECYLKVFYQTGVLSAYEYLERRFSPGIRKMGSLVFSLQMIMYMSIVLYAPALALSQVTGLHVWGSVAAIALVCTFYTTVGGMKAVMWTDAFQTFIMIGSMLVVVIKGGIDVGGFGFVWQEALNSGRIDFFNFDPSPFQRHTVWTVVFGGYFTWQAIYGVNQAQVQRYLTTPTMKMAQQALWWNLLGLIILISICCMGGLVIYAKYAGCDPLQSNLIKASDQLFPLFVMDTLGFLPGLPGLFVAGIFSGALSTVSSGLNSMAAVVLEDFIRPTNWGKKMTELQATRVSKGLALSFGLLCFALVAVAEQLGNVLQAALSIFGMVGGPLLGVFTLGMFFPWANSIGAAVGTGTSFIVTFWIGIGAQVVKPYIPKMPTSIANCSDTSNLTSTLLELSNTTLTTMSVFLPTTPAGEVAPLRTEDDTFILYRLSYLWYSGLATFIVITVGLIVSAITGMQDPKDLDPKLICPLFERLTGLLPASLQSKFKVTVGTNYNNENEKMKKNEEMSSISNGKSAADNLGFDYRENNVSNGVYKSRNFDAPNGIYDEKV